MKIDRANFSIMVFLSILSVSLSFYSFQLNEQVKKKDLAIQNLEAVYEIEIGKAKSFIQNLSESKDAALRNPSWEELKTFLELDNTNELIYKNESFDCSGFSIELFKHARAAGFRCGIIEIGFDNSSGHMLNVFETTDKGQIFIDDTGNEKGTENDEIAYVKVGSSFGTIELDKVKEKMVSCNVNCSQFAKEVTYTTYTNLFDYDYFAEFLKCKEFYGECVNSYNKAVDKYNKGNREYNGAELRKWLDNIEILEKELTKEKVYIISEGDIVKNIQIYW